MAAGLFVSGLPKSTTAEELNHLFSKILRVKEVYIPPVETITGLYRNFAIVRFDTSSNNNVGNEDLISDRVNKCIKAYNGSLWKGSKLKVSAAKAYYQSIREKERETIEQKLGVFCPPSTCNIVPSSFHDLNIKKGPNKFVKVSTKPILLSVFADLPEARLIELKLKQKVSFHGKRIVFNVQPDDKETILHFENISTIASRATDMVATQNLPEKGNMVHTPAVPASIDAPVLKPKKPEGGGRRVGFGTLLQAPIASTKTVDGGPTTATEPLLDPINDEYIDAEPCIDQSELQADALQREKLRALSVLDCVLRSSNNHPLAGSEEKTDMKGPSRTESLSSQLKSSGAKEEYLPVTDSQGVEGETRHFDNSFANLGILKNIFHREVGVECLNFA